MIPCYSNALCSDFILFRRSYVLNLELHQIALENVVLKCISNVETALRLDVSCRCALA